MTMQEKLSGIGRLGIKKALVLMPLIMYFCHFSVRGSVTLQLGNQLPVSLFNPL